MRQPLKEAFRWASQAENDLKFVEWLWKEKTFFDKGCFISQQAGEKILKACLYLDIAKVSEVADPRRPGRSCICIPRALDNKADAACETFPKGKN